MAGWSTNTWNTGSWGTGVDNIVIPTGIAAAFGIGLVSTDSTVEQGWGRDAWGQRSWGNPSQIVTPVTPEDAMTVALNSVTIDAEINAGWGGKNWGDNSWGVASNVNPSELDNALTAALGNENIIIDVTTGPGTNNNQLITTTLNDVTIDIQTKVFPSGFPLTGALGTADAGPDAMATGNAMSMGLGTLEAFNQTGWGRQGWNVNAWGVEGQFATANVTGIAMTAAAGTLGATGTADVTLSTLNVVQATLGNVDPAPDAEIVGEPMVAVVGNALGLAGAGANPTSQLMTAGLGSVTAVPSQEVDVTGLPLNNQLSSAFNVVIHIDVQVSGLSLTMNEGSANALIWNEVDTGSAPITPPGWQEVAA